MERKKKKKLERHRECTWGQCLADNKEIAKERYSLKHQGVCVSPRYYSDKNLTPRPKMRSVASQVGNLDQGATGDHNSSNNLDNLKANSLTKLENLKNKISCNDYTNQPIINCCYDLGNQPTDIGKCQHYTQHQKRGLANMGEYNYCQEEYYYYSPNCHCFKTCAHNNNPQKAENKCHYRRQNTDLNTQHFYKKPQENLNSPERINKSKKSKPNKSECKCKTKESYEQYNENKKLVGEERINKKHKEKIAKKQSNNKPLSNEKNLTEISKIKQLLKEENARKLIQYLDQYVDEHEKELQQDLKDLQSKATNSSSTLNTTIKITSEEKYCQVKIKKQKISSKENLLEKGCVNKQYSMKTLKMLKKMTIKEYKPLKPKEEEKRTTCSQTSSNLSKHLEEKLKNYREYMQKFEKEQQANKSIQILKSPPDNFTQQESEEFDIIQKETKILQQTSRNERQSSREQLENLIETLAISQDSLRNIPGNITQQYQNSIDNFTTLNEPLRVEESQPKQPRDHLTAKRVKKHNLEALNDSESFEEFRYEYGANSESTKTWDDYGKYHGHDAMKYNKPAFPERENKLGYKNRYSAKPLADVRSNKHFPHDYGTQRAEEFQNNYKKQYQNREKAQSRIHDSELSYISSLNNSFSDQRRLAVLQNDIKTCSKSKTQQPKSKETIKTFYKDRRKEVLETKQYTQGKPTELEHKEVKYQQKYMQKYLKDSESHTKRIEQIRLQYELEKSKGTKEKRVNANEHLNSRESIIYNSNANAQSTRFYKDNRRNLSEGEATLKPRSIVYEDKTRDFGEGLAEVTKDESSKYYSDRSCEQRLPFYRDKRSEFRTETLLATKEPRYAYNEELEKDFYGDKRSEFRKETLLATKEPRYSYNVDLENDFHDDKRSDCREDILIASKGPRSAYYKDHRKDHKFSKTCENERNDFKQVSQLTNDQRFEYYKPKMEEYFEENYAMTKHPIYQDYEKKQEDNSEGRHEIYQDYLHKKGDTFKERYEMTKQDYRDEKGDHSEGKYTKIKQPMYQDYADKNVECSEEIYKQQVQDYKDNKKDNFEERYAMTEHPRYAGYYEDEIKAINGKYKREDFKESKQPIVDEKVSKYYERHSLEAKPFTSREPNFLFNKDTLSYIREENPKEKEVSKYKNIAGDYKLNDEYERGNFRQRNQPLIDEQSSKYYDRIRDSFHEKPFENRFPNVKHYEGKRNDTLEENYNNNDAKSSFTDERQTRKESTTTICNKDFLKRPLENDDEDFSSTYLKDKIKDSLMVKQPANNKKSTCYEQKEDNSNSKDYTKEIKDFKQEKTSVEYLMEELSPSKLERETEKSAQNEILKQDDENLLKIDNKSQTSSYMDFKHVMDKNLGYSNAKHSRTDCTNEPNLNKQQAHETFNKETSEINATSSHPATTEQALQFLKNLIETSSHLGLESEECSNSVTLTAKDLMDKLRSCQSSLQSDTKTNSEQMKSLEDVTFSLHEKSTPDLQYKDLETPTDSSDNQIKSNQNIPTQMPETSADLKLLQQESYHYEDKLNDELQTQLPEDSQKNVVCCGDNKDLPYLLSNHNYRPLPSPRRLAAFDPAVVPLKGILKPCRDEEIPDLGNCDLITQRTISIISLNNKDAINMHLDSQMICQKGEEELVQNLNGNTQCTLTSGTTISQNVCQDCQQEYESNIAAWTANNSLKLISHRPPTFKQCPCMLDTYKRMLNNYYQERN